MLLRHVLGFPFGVGRCYQHDTTRVCDTWYNDTARVYTYIYIYIRIYIYIYDLEYVTTRHGSLLRLCVRGACDSKVRLTPIRFLL